MAILLLFYRRTGHEHPYLDTVITNYVGLLLELGLNGSQVEARRQALVEEVLRGD